MASLLGTGEALRACTSVLRMWNSTPVKPSLIMRATAFEPPPPTPITLIFVPSRVSSWIMNFRASIGFSLFGHRNVSYRNTFYRNTFYRNAFYRNSNPTNPGGLGFQSRFDFTRAEYMVRP